MGVLEHDLARQLITVLFQAVNIWGLELDLLVALLPQLVDGYHALAFLSATIATLNKAKKAKRPCST